MISVPVVTGDIADAMISASQMIYASRMEERILYHACEANISYGKSRISYRVSNISLKSTELYSMIVKKEVCKRDYIDLLDRQNWI